MTWVTAWSSDEFGYKVFNYEKFCWWMELCLWNIVFIWNVCESTHTWVWDFIRMQFLRNVLEHFHSQIHLPSSAFTPSKFKFFLPLLYFWKCQCIHENLYSNLIELTLLGVCKFFCLVVCWRNSRVATLACLILPNACSDVRSNSSHWQALVLYLNRWVVSC